MYAQINITTERYVERLHVEAFVQADGRGGTLAIRPIECPECAFESHPFDETLRVLDDGAELRLDALARWGQFPGDVVFAKGSGAVVAVKRDPR